jgi:hypothetical protein
VDRVLARLDELGLERRPTDYGYAAQCPHHLSGAGRLNFDVTVLKEPRTTPSGSVLPAGTVLLRCQAYGDSTGPDACTQDAVIAALGLWPCDLFPDGRGQAERGPRFGSRLSPLGEPEPRPPLSDDEVERWTVRAEEYEAALGPDRRRLLARHLAPRGGRLRRALADALGRFHVGWREPDLRQVGGDLVVGRCWTVPEYDGQERVTAINRRYEDGEKRVMSGSRRGLYVPDGWRDMPGPVFCPEGFSDAAVLVAAGCCAVGRPNAGGGADLLAGLLAGDRRPVVVLGENDDRPILQGGRPALLRPGYDGAVACCARLRRALRRADVTVKMPPEGFNDVREFLTRGGGRP